MKCPAATLSFLALCWGTTHAAEITTNGTGGGVWSEAATWRGGAVPKAEDEVTIRKGDAVVFDRNDDGKTTCARLFIDPQGVLRFKTGIGKVVFVVGGVVESFGLLKLDGTISADDFHEFRLVGKTPEDRKAKFDKGSGVVAAGKANLPGGKHNVLICSRAPDPKAADVTALQEVKGGVVDVQRADLVDVKLHPTDVDNTGARPGERCNIRNNSFRGRAVVYLTNCDTPVVTDNSFDYDGPPWVQPGAIGINGAYLPEIRNNTIRGAYYYGINAYGISDAVIAGNTIEKTSAGIYTVGQNNMYKGNTFREVAGAFVVTSMSGSIEDCVFEKCTYAVHVSTATIQMTNCVFRDPPTKEAHAIDFAAGEVTLINCNFGPESVTLPKMLPKADRPLVTAMHYLILKVNGETPEDTQVDVRTTNPTPPIAPGAADLNVRNVPAPLLGSRTPLPQSLSPILLKGWVIDRDGKTVPAPEYTVRVLAPAEEGKERKVLKMLSVKPEERWFRPKPNDPAPTLEVNLK